MATALLKAKGAASISSAAVTTIRRAFASVFVGSDIIVVAPNVSLQKARTCDEGVASKFFTIYSKGKKVIIFGLPSKNVPEEKMSPRRRKLTVWSDVDF